MIPAPYPLTQKKRLVEEVEALTNELGRPVCSKDLVARWKSHPEKRPSLVQSAGQLLIKASRPVSGDNPVLICLGLIGNLAFYAADDDPRWAVAFRLHEVRLRIKDHAKWAVPQQAIYLMGTAQEDLARNALAGFVADWKPLLNEPTIAELAAATTLPGLLKLAMKEVPGNFAGRQPNMVSREAVSAIMEEETRRRNPFCGVNLQRHLATLAWHMTRLFHETGYWSQQATFYCAARWPEDHEDSMLGRAAWICSIYGTPKDCFHGNGR